MLGAVLQNRIEIFGIDRNNVNNLPHGVARKAMRPPAAGSVVRWWTACGAWSWRRAVAATTWTPRGCRLYSRPCSRPAPSCGVAALWHRRQRRQHPRHHPHPSSTAGGCPWGSDLVRRGGEGLRHLVHSCSPFLTWLNVKIDLAVLILNFCKTELEIKNKQSPQVCVNQVLFS